MALQGRVIPILITSVLVCVICVCFCKENNFSMKSFLPSIHFLLSFFATNTQEDWFCIFQYISDTFMCCTCHNMSPAPSSCYYIYWLSIYSSGFEKGEGSKRRKEFGLACYTHWSIQLLFVSYYYSQLVPLYKFSHFGSKKWYCHFL